ncbi:hypothetical protein NMY22_g3034 [Coprinellus aureogranulatus]|nr:hypothetical protein NMY22_g3034 [Coprinellus aureogranulatus]
MTRDRRRQQVGAFEKIIRERREQRGRIAEGRHPESNAETRSHWTRLDKTLLDERSTGTKVDETKSREMSTRTDSIGSQGPLRSQSCPVIDKMEEERTNPTKFISAIAGNARTTPRVPTPTTAAIVDMHNTYKTAPFIPFATQRLPP